MQTEEVLKLYCIRISMPSITKEGAIIELESIIRGLNEYEVFEGDEWESPESMTTFEEVEVEE